MSTDAPLPPLTQADVPAWVRLRRDAGGEPSLEGAWWPRLVRVKLATRRRPLGQLDDLEIDASRFILFLTLVGAPGFAYPAASLPLSLLRLVSGILPVVWLVGEPAALYHARNRIVAARRAR